MDLSPTSIEQELVQPAQDGSEAAFRQLYDHFLPKIYGYVVCRIGQRQEAEDITSTIFLKLVENIGRFKIRGEGSFAAWIFTIARNELKQYYRRKRPEASLTQTIAVQPLIEKGLLQAENFQIIRMALAELSERRAEVVRLRFLGGLRNKEIAILLKLDERTVAAHISRALEDLRNAFSTFEDEERQR